MTCDHSPAHTGPTASLLRRLPLLLLPLLLLFGACQTEEPRPQETGRDGIPFRKNGTLTFLREGDELVTIDVEIADTDSARMRGLMQRQSLPERSGMLFIFDQEEPQGIWMANTPLALDILFVSADSQIVKVEKYTRPFSPRTIPSGAPAQYVVEVRAGFADTYGVTETDRVRWVRTTDDRPPTTDEEGG